MNASARSARRKQEVWRAARGRRCQLRDRAKAKFVGLIGPNGAGKTTLFNLVNGVLKPDQGSIIFGDHDITGWPPEKIARHGLARTHQIVKPLNELTVLDNVVVGACFGSEHLAAQASS